MRRVVYTWNEKREYIGVAKEGLGVKYPRSTTIAPPEFDNEKEIPVWNGANWEIKERK